ncbi:MAG: hypothetical protein AB7K68_12780 [Bacteriovoracia bacterium]
MKNILILSLAIAALSQGAEAGQSKNRTIASQPRSRSLRINDIVSQVSKRNYKVQTSSLRAYQAKTNIEKARADLLPRLTIWTIAKVAVDPLSLVDSITEIAPFLVPANWSRLEQNKILAKAESEGYRALWANEVHITKSLYAKALLDEGLLEHISESITELERLHRIVKTHELFGGAKPGTSRDIEIRILGLKEDEQNMRLLISQEIDELSYALGMPADVKLTLAPLELPKVQGLKAMSYKDFEAKAVSESPERKQYAYLISTVDYIKEEISYSFFGSSPISRGVAGGVFDAIPESSGVFAQNESIKIADSQADILRLQQKGVVETLKRQLRGLSNQFNSDVLNYGLYQKRLELSEESATAIARRTQLGERIDAVEYSENIKNKIQAKAAMLTLNYRVLTNQDRLNRMTFSGDYSRNSR